MTDCAGFMKASSSGLITQPAIKEGPAPPTVPTYKWLLTVYSYDVLQRLDVVKASLTSTFGRVLKMDSTKKVVKKVAGDAAHTAAWATNVGNEHGQVLMSVLTACEWAGLGPMVQGLINRYETARVDPPELLYVDRDCCGESAVSRHFAAWPDIEIRLDIWHFMRRFSAGVTTDAHRLYGPFMSRLSQSIFQWHQDDIDLLKSAKRNEMEAANLPNISDLDVVKQLSKKELALHCRRTTRGTSETTHLIQTLLEVFDSAEGRDSMGVPLLDHDRIWNIWDSQRRHVSCIHDPVNLPLYTQTGTLKKGSIILPVYRCARGSTSLESFHLHLNRFIPGTSASATHFQVYLLEGLYRWNQDRATAALTGKFDSSTYSSELKHAANQLGEKVFKKAVFENFVSPRTYTGEKIGVEYLYSQTGQVLVDVPTDPDNEASAVYEDQADEDEGFQEGSLGDVQDQTVGTVEDMVSSAKQTPPTVSTPVTVPVTVPDPTAIVADATLATPVISSSITHTTTTTAVPVPSTSDTLDKSSAAADSMDVSESVGPDNIEGYARVEALAEYLVSLCACSSMAVTHLQAAKIIQLWNRLLPHDKSPTLWPKRHKAKLTTGRFKPSKTTVVAGVDSTKRCFLGQNTGPAQFPDCNRYVEAIVIRLCDMFPTTAREGNRRIQRWSLILRAYKKIREMVLDNRLIMNSTDIQLFEINQTTLTQWFFSRARKHEQDILEQGLPKQPPVAVTTAPVPPPASAPTTATFSPAASASPYVFVLPPNTAGDAKVRRRQTQPDPSPMKLVEDPVMPGSFVLAPADPAESVPYTTMRYRNRKLDKEAGGKVYRKYIRKSTGMVCGKCHKERTADRHKQHYGNWFCADTSKQSYEEWLAARAEKGYGKQKKK